MGQKEQNLMPGTDSLGPHLKKLSISLLPICAIPMLSHLCLLCSGLR